MGLFFDPIKKKPQTWVFAAFILVPILLIVFGLIYGKVVAQKHPTEEKEESAQEFFQKFPTK